MGPHNPHEHRVVQADRALHAHHKEADRPHHGRDDQTRHDDGVDAEVEVVRVLPQALRFPLVNMECFIGYIYIALDNFV